MHAWLWCLERSLIQQDRRLKLVRQKTDSAGEVRTATFEFGQFGYMSPCASNWVTPCIGCVLARPHPSRRLEPPDRQHSRPEGRPMYHLGAENGILFMDPELRQGLINNMERARRIRQSRPPGPDLRDRLAALLLGMAAKFDAAKTARATSHSSPGNPVSRRPSIQPDSLAN